MNFSRIQLALSAAAGVKEKASTRNALKRVNFVSIYQHDASRDHLEDYPSRFYTLFHLGVK